MSNKVLYNILTTTKRNCYIILIEVRGITSSSPHIFAIECQLAKRLPNTVHSLNEIVKKFLTFALLIIKSVSNQEQMVEQPMMMDCEEQPMFDMEDDYGFYEVIDVSDRSAVAYPTPTMSGLSDEVDDDNTAPLSITCGSRIEDDNEDSLISSPPILSPFIVDSIVEDGLPWSLQDCQFNRLFSSSRDGESFSTFMRSVRGHSQTIIVAKTSDGKIVGGYATDVWSGRKQQSEASSSQGETNHSFLFAIEPPSTIKTKHHQAPISTNTSFIPGLGDLGTSPTSALDFDFGQLSLSKHHDKKKKKPHVNIFKPSQKFKQACQISNKMISMVDDDTNLSLSIENSFSRGVSCTRDDRQEEFTIVEFEVYSLED